MSATPDDLDERIRILNVLGMYERGELSTEGMPMRVLPLMCKTVLSIRKLNRLLLDKIKSRSWTPFSQQHPQIEDEILLRFDDTSGTHVECTKWSEDDEEFFNFAGDDGAAWMKLPPIE